MHILFTRICASYLFVIFQIFHPLFCTSQVYPVSQIPSDLKVNADAVIRRDSVHVRLEGNEQHCYHFRAITLLNEKAKHHAVLNFEGNKLKKIKDVKAILFDSSGRQILEKKMSDFVRVDGEDDISFINSQYNLLSTFLYDVYPYTLVYAESYERKQILFIESWMPIEAKTSIQDAVFEVSAHKADSFQAASLNIQPPSVREESSRQIFSWHVLNYKTLPDQGSLLPSSLHWSPAVFPSVPKIELDGIKGRGGSWHEYGKFIYEISRPTERTDSNLVRIVHKITDTIKSSKAKIEALYHYLQSNYRYVSITLGTGGWRPLEPNLVFKKGYGDCKALTKLMQTMLQEIGIKSYYTLVMAGKNTDIPYDRQLIRIFNHVILACVDYGDTTWLECTSHRNQPGYLGSFTEGRYALLTDSTGGYLVCTPDQMTNKNRIRRLMKGILDSNGVLRFHAAIYSQGDWDNQVLFQALPASEQELNRGVYELFSQSIEKPTNFKKLNQSIYEPAFEIQFDSEIPRLTNMRTNLIAIKPEILKLNDYNFHLDRSVDFKSYDAFSKNDSIVMELPPGLSLVKMPTPTVYKNQLLELSRNYFLKNNTLTIVSTLTQHKGIIPLSEKAKLVEFENLHQRLKEEMILFRRL